MVFKKVQGENGNSIKPENMPHGFVSVTVDYGVFIHLLFRATYLMYIDVFDIQQYLYSPGNMAVFYLADFELKPEMKHYR